MPPRLGCLWQLQTLLVSLPSQSWRTKKAGLTAGYKPKVEKWDSDSDSDETDEEDLKV